MPLIISMDVLFSYMKMIDMICDLIENMKMKMINMKMKMTIYEND